MKIIMEHKIKEVKTQSIEFELTMNEAKILLNELFEQSRNKTLQVNSQISQMYDALHVFVFGEIPNKW